MVKYQPTRRSWPAKFKFAFAGLLAGIRGQSSFVVHLLMTGTVIVAAALLKVNLIEWGLLVLCIAIVLAAECFNSALEQMAQSITDQHNEQIGKALDIASGAVLVAAIGAAIVGAIVLGSRLWFLVFHAANHA